MRLFHAQVLDEYLEGAGANAGISEPWSYLLTRAETLRFTCVVDGVSGASPTLSLFLDGGLAVLEYTESTKVLLNGVALVSGTNTFSATYSPLDATNPPPRALFMEADLNGTTPKAHVRVWVCGRGPQLLDPMPMVQPSFSAQYQAARQLADEDRVSIAKRVTKPGVSQAFAPELFIPSLRWER